MDFDTLSDKDKIIVGQALRAAADGPFFPEWEFQSLFGMRRSQVRAIADAWPQPAASLEDVTQAVNNSLNNLLGYPHHMEATWSQWISIDCQRLNELFNRLRGRRGESSFSPLM